MADYDFDLREYWRIIRKRKFIIIFTTVAMGLFSLIFAILGSPTPIYKTSAAVKFEKTSLASGLYLQTVSMSPGDDMQTQMSIIKSYYIIEVVAKKLGMIPEDATSDEIRNNPKYINIINRLKGAIDTEQEAQSAIINISVTSEDPKFAQRLANTVVSVYKEQRSIELNKRTVDARKFVEEQLKTAKEKLKHSEDAVRDFREKQKVISIESQSSVLMSQLTTYKTAYDKAVNDLQKIEETKRQLDLAESTPLSSKTSFWLDEATPAYKALNDRLIQLLMDRDSLLITYTESYPQVVEIRKRIHETVQNMQAQVSAQLRSLRESIRFLKNRMAETDGQIESLPEKGLELTRLERNAKVDMEVYSLLEKSYQESLIKEAEKVEDVQIVRPALEPTTPTNPPKTQATAGIGTLLGLILGIVFAFLIETFDTSIGTIEEVESYLGVPVLGVIPQVSLKEIKEALYSKYSDRVDEDTAERASRLISHFAPQSTLAESYRALRTNLNFACREGHYKSIVFTSATPREGKTTTTVNLAVTIAQTGQKVLLVEADLRKPVVAHMFGIDQAPGLTDALMGNYDWEKSVRTIADIMMGKLNIDEVLETPGMDNLHIITSGTIPPNPAELINSATLDDFFVWAKSHYDFIMIDAPPVLAATDAALLGSKVDGVVFVYRVGKISRLTIKRAKAQLDNVKSLVLGVVLNGIKADISADFQDYDYKYYHYYGGQKEEATLRDKLLALPGSIWNFIKKRFKKEKASDETETEEDEKELLFEREPVKTPLWKILVLLLALLALAAGVAFQAGYLHWRDVVSIYSTLSSYHPFSEKKKNGTSGVKKTISRTDSGSVAGTAKEAEPSPGVASAPPETKTPPAPARPDQEKTGGRAEKTAVAAPDKPYSIQIRAIRDPEETERFVKALTAKGLDAYAMKVNLKEIGIWHRIYIGHFSDEQEAIRFLKDHRMMETFPGSLVRNVALSTPLEKGAKK